MALAICLGLVSPALAGPAVPEKAEVVFADDFEDGQAPGWSGGKVVTGHPADTKGALEAGGNAFILTRSVSFKSTEQTFLTFRYFAEQVYSLCAQFSDPARGDNFKTFLVPVVRKRWATLTFNITADIQGCANHTAGIVPGDTLVNVLIWPADKLPNVRFLIDDVAIYRIGAAARAARLPAALDEAERDWLTGGGHAWVVPRNKPQPPPLPPEFKAEIARLKEQASTAATDDAVGQLEAKAADLRARVNRAMLRRKMGEAREFKLGSTVEEYVVGLESPLVRVTDRNPAMPFVGQVADVLSFAAAGHEYENLQLVVIPVEKDLQKVQLNFTDLTGKAGTISKENLEWRLVEDVQTKPSYGYPRSIHGWKPDPLLPGEPFDVKVGRMKPLWITVYVPPEAKPGDYVGAVTVAPANSHPVTIEVNLHVWNYRLPLRGRFRHMCQFQPQSNEKRRENYACLLKYRLSPTAQYSRACSPVAEDIQFCYDRGITTFVAGNHPGPTINEQVVRPYYEALKAAGCLDLAVIYIGDEGTSPEALAQFRQKAVTVKRNFPGLRVMVGGSTPRKELIGYLDVWDPIISMTAGRGEGYQYHQAACDERKALGEEVLWYMAGVRPPYTCIELDPPATSMRLWPWVTWKYGVQGWEVYGTQGGWDKPTNKTWPKTPWDTYTWRNYNGSGQFFYPGPDGVPLASIRIENARDGIEDYEALHLLQDALELVKARNVSGVDPALVERARGVLAVRPEVMTNMWDWSRDPAVITAARWELGSVLNDLVTAIRRQAFDDFVARQAEARRKTNNDLYQKRLEAFLASPAATTSAPVQAPVPK